MNDDPKKRNVFDFELGYIQQSPCLTCKKSKNLPECQEDCKLLDKLRTLLARGISCQRSTFR
jgi:hypothetical protein